MHNLGGNPFGSVQRSSASDHPDKVRRSKKTIVFRQDQAFAPFVYPKVSKDAEVVIIADEDYLGQYLENNLAHTLPTSNIKIYNVESTSPQLLQEVLEGEHPEYEHDFNKVIAGAWYIEAQSEVGGTLTSALTGKNSILDHFTREQRGSKTWSQYKQAYLQGSQGLNISDQELAVAGKVLQEELNQDVRLKVTIQTDLGLQTVEATAKSSTTDIDAVFNPIGEPKDLNVKNTDQTTMILMSDLQIESVQAEELIKRLASQGIISYPRTEYEGISPKENIDSERLVNVWISYHPEYESQRAEIIQGIERIQETTPELPRSGILVLNKSNFKENTVERKTVESIAKANIWASLNYYEIDGNLMIVDQNNKNIGDSRITIISKDPEYVGQVIDVQTERRQGMSDKEMFVFLSKEELGTVATRTNLVKRLEEWGFLLKSPKGEYKLDDRMKVITLAVGKADSDLTTGEFSKWLKHKRSIVENNPLEYTQQKDILYGRLASIVSDLSSEKVIQDTEHDFQYISQRSQLDTFLKGDLQDEMVQIDDS